MFAVVLASILALTLASPMMNAATLNPVPALNASAYLGRFASD
jgi:hypothetical protein